MYYKIRHWDERYENSQSRKYSNISWVPIPNKQDGRKYRLLAKRDPSGSVFGMFILLVEIASKCPVRGELKDSDGHSLTAFDFELMSGYPEDVFQRALDILSDQSIGWLEKVIESTDSPVINSDTGSALPACSQHTPSALGACYPERTERTEQKRKETTTTNVRTNQHKRARNNSELGNEFCGSVENNLSDQNNFNHQEPPTKKPISNPSSLPAPKPKKSTVIKDPFQHNPLKNKNNVPISKQNISKNAHESLQGVVQKDDYNILIHPPSPDSPYYEVEKEIHLEFQKMEALRKTKNAFEGDALKIDIKIFKTWAEKLNILPAQLATALAILDGVIAVKPEIKNPAAYAWAALSKMSQRGTLYEWMKLNKPRNLDINRFWKIK